MRAGGRLPIPLLIWCYWCSVQRWTGAAGVTSRWSSVIVRSNRGSEMLTPDEMYVEAVRHIHERLVDLLVVTTVVIDNPRRAPRLKFRAGDWPSAWPPWQPQTRPESTGSGGVDAQ